MQALVPIMLFGWIPVSIVLFGLLPARRAALVSVIGGMLFLPVAAYDVPWLPEYSKFVAVGVGALLGAILFDSARVFALRPKWFDVPMIVWCLAPLAASLSNGLGAYDGFAAAFDQTMKWGAPYLVGRLYCRDAEGIRELAIALFFAGLVYMPFCLWEVRMSPRLHFEIYGIRQHNFTQTARYGGWRPMVFMQHGLAVGLLMASAALSGAVLWASGAMKRIRGVPIEWLVVALLVTTVLCKSALAILLLFAGAAVYLATSRVKVPVFLLALIAAAPTYMVVRTAGGWDGQQLVTLASKLGQQRADSIRTRVESENILMVRAFDRKMFGWGGYSRNLVFNERDRKEAIPDGLWIIAFGKTGLVGLVSLTVMLLLPGILLWRKLPAKLWFTPSMAPALAMTLLLTLWMLDNLLNAMLNPIFLLAAGGLTAWLGSVKRVDRRSLELRSRRIRLAASRKAEIVDGQMPTPEESSAAHGASAA